MKILASLAFQLIVTLVMLSDVLSAGDAERGYQFLTEKVYLPPDFDEDSFSNVWRVWPEPLRTQAEHASPLQRRKMAFSRYGLTPRPGVDLETTQDEQFAPLQYVVSADGTWTMNCFSCHGGQVLGKTIPGLPNSRFALHTLSEELLKMKEQYAPDRPRGRMERATQFMPLGTTRGTTNAVVFGTLLMSMRDLDLNFQAPQSFPRGVHHDMDAPPWWHFKKKTHLYADAYTPKHHRALMPFMLVRSNGPEDFHRWEKDYRDIYAYLESIEAPRYPFAVNRQLAERGKVIFDQNCAECHGTYGTNANYPNRVVSIEELKTDPVRLQALSPEGREKYGQSWFTDYGKLKVIADPGGYLAPPLDGIWASAPYFHNGSVPTLWHILHPQDRPIIWTRTSENGYDQNRLGIIVEEMDRLPKSITDPREVREFFDSRQHGKKNSGHTFPDALKETEKQAVLEYLKTL